MMLTWCRKHNLHLFSDEIYALSTKPRELCKEGEHEFVSYAKIIEGDTKNNDVTVLWGMSKDFGLSGFRFSLLWTKNTDMLRAFAELAHFCEESSVCQTVIANMLNDEEYIKDHMQKLYNYIYEHGKVIICPVSVVKDE